MTERVVALALAERSYRIVIGSGVLGTAQHWQQAVRGRHVLLVSNSTVAPLYAERVRNALPDRQLEQLVLPDGEQYKTLDQAAQVFGALAALKASRDATIVALGGGVIGDLAGFAAACWMRGIACVQAPTTLLAMVDSSVGGKTAVNLAQGKNLVGAFHQPRAVLIDPDTLATLPRRELLAGFAEVIKYGAIRDPEFTQWLHTHNAALLSGDTESLIAAIETSCRHKAEIVMRDEREDGERALLNFGHTFAHALETATGYTELRHGEAVAIGMVLAARLSAHLGMAPAADTAELIGLLHRFGLPTVKPAALDGAALLELMRLDKKASSGRLRLILWRGMGRAEVVADVPEAGILAVLNQAG